MGRRERPTWRIGAGAEMGRAAARPADFTDSVLSFAARTLNAIGSRPNTGRPDNRRGKGTHVRKIASKRTVCWPRQGEGRGPRIRVSRNRRAVLLKKKVRSQAAREGAPGDGAHHAVLAQVWRLPNTLHLPPARCRPLTTFETLGGGGVHWRRHTPMCRVYPVRCRQCCGSACKHIYAYAIVPF